VWHASATCRATSTPDCRASAANRSTLSRSVSSPPQVNISGGSPAGSAYNGLANGSEDRVEELGDDAWEPGDTETREEWRAAQIEVNDPDSLLASQPFSGTHSIIDMTGVSATSAPHMVAPVPTEELDELFGTRRPAATAVAAAIENGALAGLERWHGQYVIGYDGDVPQAIYFVGYSGD
jgi:hypothetical protein